MVAWSGRRKVFTILLLIGPTILAILLFAVYPLIYNTWVSFTNRGQFHPNPDCADALASVIEPTCWLVFRDKAPVGLATPFTYEDPAYANYANLIGDLFSGPGLLSIARLLICFVPLLVAARLNRQFDQQLTRPVSSLTVWLGGLAGVLLLAFLIDLRGAYQAVTEAGDFWTVTLRTVLYVAVCIPIFFVVGLTMALILNSPHLPGRAFFRMVLIVPWAASTVAIMMSLIWQFFFREQGTINQILKLFGVEGQAWLNDPFWAFVIIVVVNVWYTYPFFMVAILGALQSIPQELYEAAEVDGASWWQRLTRITLPLLRPAILPAVVLSSITTFQLFDTVWALTRGGPSAGAGVPGGTELVMVYGYKQIFQFQAYGSAGAYAVIIFGLLFVATLYSLRISRITKGAYE